MTEFLVDENVLREFGTRGNASVRKWLTTVDDSDLRLSIATLFEKRRGARMLARRETSRKARSNSLATRSAGISIASFRRVLLISSTSNFICAPPASAGHDAAAASRGAAGIGSR